MAYEDYKISLKEREVKRTEQGLCNAKIFHGPGHQSRTYCSKEGSHTVHGAIYGNYDQYAEWVGDEVCSGFSDEPPEIKGANDED